MNEKEKKAIELLENIRNNSWTTKYIMSSDSKNAEVLLNLIEKLQKENEELKQDRNNNYQMIALSQNEMLGYIQGYEDGKKLRKSAVASIVENQQYYILNKQIEKYKECIEKLQKENKELKNFTSSIFNENIEKDFVPVQKIKDKIKEYKKMLLSCNRFSDVDRIKAINERILELEELLEGRKQNV